MKKKIFTFVLFLFLSSCGYEATHSLKNRLIYAFSISELNITGDRQINLKTKRMLNSYTNPKSQKEKSFALKIFSKSEKIVVTKNASGDATKFKNEITLSVQAIMNKKYNSNFIITENFTYDNNSKTSELKTYESRIKTNLTETAVNKIISKLASIN